MIQVGTSVTVENVHTLSVDESLKISLPRSSVI